MPLEPRMAVRQSERYIEVLADAALPASRLLRLFHTVYICSRDCCASRKCYCAIEPGVQGLHVHTTNHMIRTLSLESVYHSYSPQTNGSFVQILARRECITFVTQQMVATTSSHRTNHLKRPSLHMHRTVICCIWVSFRTWLQAQTIHV
jgi:hypothetical protein